MLRREASFVINGLLMFLLHENFDTTAKCKYENKILECSNKRLTTIPENLPRDAKEIYLNRNSITVIVYNTFSGMENLEVLFLNQNQISIIQNGSFSSLPNLKKLSLDDNYLYSSSIEVMAFKELPALKELSVMGNKFWTENLIFPLRDLEKLKNLRSLSFDAFQTFKFSDLHSVNKRIRDIKIGLSYMWIYKLTNQTFASHSSLQIKTLELRISDIEPGALCHFSNLEILNITINRGENIMDNIFRSLQCLRGHNITALQINRNVVTNPLKMGKFHFSSISGVCINRLILSNNNIVRLDTMSLQMYGVRDKCLEVLDLSENHIDTENTSWLFSFAFLSQLKILKLVWPSQDFIPDKCDSTMPNCISFSSFHFNLPSKLEVFYFKNTYNQYHFKDISVAGGSRLQTLDLSYTRTCVCGSGLTVRGLPNLKHLALSGWMFEDINESFLSQFPKLETFVCQYCSLNRGFRKHSNIQAFFKNLTDLKIIDLFGNQINNLPDNMFDYLKSSVRSLNLSQNSFTDLPIQPHLFPKLASLDLRKNHIRNFDKITLDSIKKAKNVKIYLGANPFQCVCASVPLMMVLNRSNIADYDEIKCSTENGNVLLLSDFAKNIKTFKQHCIEKSWIVAGIVSVLTFLVSLCVGTVLYKYRSYLKYYRTYIRIRGKDAIDDDMCLYDAFMSYCHNDWEKHVSNIYHKLTTNGMKICIDDINFNPGDPIEENIIRAIDNSRKVMFVVTENFLSSHWGTLEVEFVRYHVCTKKGEKKIFLLLEEGIDIERLPVALKNIWRRITCIRWPKNMTEEKENCWYQKLGRRLKN